jgi:hypothetical protein
MNERIKTLSTLAWEQRALMTKNKSMDDAYTEKFAELLIDDIAQKVKHIKVWDIDLGVYIKQQYQIDNNTDS